MKRTFTIIAILAGACFGQAQEEQKWELVCSLVGENWSKVYAQGADTVYVVGEKGLIAQSTDNGLTWDKKHFFDEDTLNDIVFCTHEVGFVVGNNGTILRTQDAGLSWEQMSSGTSQNINAIAAFDLNNIWLVGNSSLIMHSTDMGETWTMKSFLSDNRNLNEIKCKESRGYIAGQGNIVLNTEDGGMKWEKQQILFESLAEYDEIRSLNITDNKVYAFGDRGGWYSIGDFVYTEDNINWHILGNFINSSNIYFQDEQKGFMAYYSNTTCGDCNIGLWILKTIDGGDTWDEVYYGSECEKPSPLGNFAFSLDNEFGYCVLRGYVMRTPYTGKFENCPTEPCPPYYGTTKIENDNSVEINQQDNELYVTSYPKIIDKVELITINGIKIMQKTGQATRLNLNVSNLPNGIYLVNVWFLDKTNHVSKWIKN